MDVTIPLSGLSAELERRYGVRSPGYRAAYNAVLDGRLPAIRRNVRYYVSEENLLVAAGVLGMVPGNSAGATALRVRTAAWDCPGFVDTLKLCPQFPRRRGNPKRVIGPVLACWRVGDVAVESRRITMSPFSLAV